MNNKVVLWIVIIVGGLIGKFMYYSYKQELLHPSTPRNETKFEQGISSANIDRIVNGALETMKQNNSSVRFLLENDPAILNTLTADLREMIQNPKFAQKVKNKEPFKFEDISSMMSRVLVELPKYTIKAPDNEFYNYYVSYNKMLKKHNCQIYPLPPQDKESLDDIVLKLLKEAKEHPIAFTPLSETKINNLMDKVTKYYEKQGYSMRDLGIFFGAIPGSLTSAQRCNTQVHFTESILSLPKKQAIELLRMMLYEEINANKAVGR